MSDTRLIVALRISIARAFVINDTRETTGGVANCEESDQDVEDYVDQEGSYGLICTYAAEIERRD